MDESDTDHATLRELKKELGLPEDKPLPDNLGQSLDVESAIHNAVTSHASVERSPGFIKAHGLRAPYI